MESEKTPEDSQKKNWKPILEKIGLATVAILAIGYLLWPTPKASDVKVEDLIKMANVPKLETYPQETAPPVIQLEPEKKARKEQRQTIIDIISLKENPDARYLLISPKTGSSLLMVETKNTKLIELIDKKQLRIGIPLDIETEPNTDEALGKLAKERQATPVKLKKLKISPNP